MKFRSYLNILILSLSVISCSTINEITFQEMKPASISFPDGIRNIGVIKYSPSYENVNVLNEEMDGNIKLSCESFAERLADAHYFDNVIISDSTLYLPIDSITQQIHLDKIDINRICDNLGVDAFCVFENLKIKFTQKNEKERNVFPLLIGVVKPKVNIYLPNRNKPLCILNPKDTLYWDMFPNLTAQGVVNEASYYASNKVAEMIVPYWEKCNKYYYDGGDVNMRDAGVLLRENNWNKAKELWENIYNKKKNSSSKAAYNIALYYEYNDDLDNALLWIGKALNSSKNGTELYKNIMLYKIQLEQRKNIYSQLEIQMHRFK